MGGGASKKYAPADHEEARATAIGQVRHPARCACQHSAHMQRAVHAQYFAMRKESLARKRSRCLARMPLAASVLRAPALALRRWSSRLFSGALLLAICDGAVAHTGLGVAIDMLRALLGTELTDSARLHLAFSLLQSLPWTNALMRNAPLRRAIDLSDIETLDERLVQPAAGKSPGGSAMHIHALVRRPGSGYEQPDAILTHSPEELQRILDP